MGHTIAVCATAVSTMCIVLKVGRADLRLLECRASYAPCVHMRMPHKPYIVCNRTVHMHIISPYVRILKTGNINSSFQYLGIHRWTGPAVQLLTRCCSQVPHPMLLLACAASMHVSSVACMHCLQVLLTCCCSPPCEQEVRAAARNASSYSHLLLA